MSALLTQEQLNAQTKERARRLFEAALAVAHQPAGSSSLDLNKLPVAVQAEFRDLFSSDGNALTNTLSRDGFMNGVLNMAELYVAGTRCPIVNVLRNRYFRVDAISCHPTVPWTEEVLDRLKQEAKGLLDSSRFGWHVRESDSNICSPREGEPTSMFRSLSNGRDQLQGKKCEAHNLYCLLDPESMAVLDTLNPREGKGIYCFDRTAKVNDYLRQDYTGELLSLAAPRWADQSHR